MKQKRIIGLGLVLLLLIIIVVTWLMLKQFVFPNEEVSEDEVKGIVEERYGGVVKQVSRNDKAYIVIFERTNQSYQLKVNHHGGIEEVKKINGQIQLLNEEDVKELVQADSLGEIQSLTLREQSGEKVYVTDVVKGNEEREVIFHAVTGEILSNELADEQPPKNTILTEEEAIEIALESVQGEVDDIELENKDDRIFYLIEIETNDEKEAVVEVNAITGESTVTWD